MRKICRATEGNTSLVIYIFLKRVVTPAPASLSELKLPWKEPDTQHGKFQPMAFVENRLIILSTLPAQPWDAVQKNTENNKERKRKTHEEEKEEIIFTFSSRVSPLGQGFEQKCQRDFHTSFSPIDFPSCFLIRDLVLSQHR